MVEGGARIITSFLARQLANYLVLTVVPRLVGGVRAVGNLGAFEPARFPVCAILALNGWAKIWSCGAIWRGAKRNSTCLVFHCTLSGDGAAGVDAPPAPGQLLVQTVVSAISPGTELLIYRGQAPRICPSTRPSPPCRGR